QFIGFSGLGTPLWINKAVAKADFRVAIGRICPHSDPGYEGGGKMILPGVSSMESVMHTHRMCCSPRTGPGTLDENPVRVDMDEIGKMAKLDFILNMVSKPGRGSGGENIWNEGFAGDSILAHRCGVEFGDKNVWGAEIGERADITIAFPGPSGIGNANLTYAKQGTKPTGTVIYLANEPQTPRKLDNPPHWWYTQEDLKGCDLETIVRRYQHFKIVNPEDVWITDGAATGASRQFHSKDQELVKISSQSPSEIQKELDTATAKALEKHGASARIVVLSDGNTLPLPRFHLATVHA
ncbi:lactate racemase domain-containing protein, partial [Candidatus Bathyarchaeota archaeon]|nr:lactate racemase domain-containing protein [Candidatus Bathyarchaeota archaeon]